MIIIATFGVIIGTASLPIAPILGGIFAGGIALYLGYRLGRYAYNRYREWQRNRNALTVQNISQRVLSSVKNMPAELVNIVAIYAA